MEKKQMPPVLGALIVGLVTAVLRYVLVRTFSYRLIAVYSALYRVGLHSTAVSLVSGLFTGLFTLVAVMVGYVIYFKAIAKVKFPVGPSILFGLLTSFVVSQIFNILTRVFSYYSTAVTILVPFVVGFLFAIAAIYASKLKAQPQSYQPYGYNPAQTGNNPQPPVYTAPQAGYGAQPTAESPYAGAQQPAYSQPQAAPQAQAPQASQPDPVSQALLAAIQPRLQVPMSAALCPRQEMTMTPGPGGVYNVKGYVNSVSLAGAPLRNRFTATMYYANSAWIVTALTLA